VAHASGLKLTNMKIDPKAREEKYAESVPADRPVYPWGLEVRLDEDALEKLALAELPDVGRALMLHARVEVTSVSDRENVEDGKAHRHRDVTLQITDLALAPAPADGDQDEGHRRAQTAAALYGGAKA